MGGTLALGDWGVGTLALLFGRVLERLSQASANSQRLLRLHRLQLVVTPPLIMATPRPVLLVEPSDQSY